MKTQSANGFKSLTTEKKMPSKLVSLSLVLAFVAGSSIFTSCKKKEEQVTQDPADTEQTMTTDNNFAENTVSDIESMGSQVSEDNVQAKGESVGIILQMSPGATVTVSGKIITVDFGTGTVGLDGRTRSGKLIYNFSASTPSALFYRNPGFSMNVTSQNYVVDGYTVTIINKTITNTTPSTIPPGLNPGTNLTWNISANVSIVKPDNGGTINWTCSRTKELTNTADTNCYHGQGVHITWSKAVVKLNGSTSGTNANQEQFTATATNLVRDFNCSPFPLRPMHHPFISGTIVYTPGSRPTRTVDFGNGACDGVATLTTKNKTFTISL